MFVKLYDQITRLFRKPKYDQFGLQTKSYQVKPSQLQAQLQKIRLKPGQCIFFWNRKMQYVDHIAIVTKQDPHKLNLLDAQLVQAIPPRSVYPEDFSGVRACRAIDFLGNLNTTYSRIIVGSPPTAFELELEKAGEIAQEISLSQMIDHKVILYSLPIVSKFCYVKWFDYDTHLKFKIGLPYLVAKKETGKLTNWISTYCGDLIGRIYHQAGVKNLPQISFLGHLYFRSSTFYEWMKGNDKIENIIMWGDPNPKKY